MVKRFLLLSLLCLSVAGITLFLLGELTNETPDNSEETTSESVTYEGVEYYHPLDSYIYIVKFDQKVYFTADENTTLDTLQITSINNNFSFAVNASYFTSDYDHAGLLILNGEQKGLLAPNDKQVTHIVRLGDRSISFDEAQNFDIEVAKDTKDTYFQTGPLVIEDNKIQQTLLSNSLNGQTRHLRTLLGFTKSGETFFVVTKKTYDLTSLANELLALPIFQNEVISVVNLDGGSSTSMYSTKVESFSYNVAKQLPFVLGIK